VQQISAGTRDNAFMREQRLIEARDQLLAFAQQVFASNQEVVGVFLSGSLAGAIRAGVDCVRTRRIDGERVDGERTGEPACCHVLPASMLFQTPSSLVPA
jgi:hypothetical protein